MVNIPSHLPKKLAISFWIWAPISVRKNNPYLDFDKTMTELRERSYNCVRIESAAGFTHDKNGTPRGNVRVHASFGGHEQFVRQNETVDNGLCNCLERLVDLFENAKKHNVYVILSSWFFLHTYWMMDEAITKSILDLHPDQYFQFFAEQYDLILKELKARNLEKQLAFLELQNEVDGLSFIRKATGFQNDEDKYNHFRILHEKAIGWLRQRHPDILVGYDTQTMKTHQALMPRNAQVWNAHTYYMWPVYGVFEQGLLSKNIDMNDPESFKHVRPFLRDDYVLFTEILKTREGLLDAGVGWTRRVWLYRNLDPDKIPQLEKILENQLELDAPNFRREADEQVQSAVSIRDKILPGVPLVYSEGSTYCASNLLSWEERSDTYWKTLEHMTRRLAENNFWGYVPRTNGGPDDRAWKEYPQRLKYLNELFLSL